MCFHAICQIVKRLNFLQATEISKLALPVPNPRPNMLADFLDDIIAMPPYSADTSLNGNVAVVGG